MFSLMHRYCCFTREPQLCSRLKLTPPDDSVAENTLTGIDTRPKLSDREAMERAAMPGSPKGRGWQISADSPRLHVPAWLTRHLRRLEAQRFHGLGQGLFRRPVGGP